MDNNVEVVSSRLTLQSKFAEVLGSRMHYFEVGEDQPVLFFHGNPVWSYIWRNIIPHVENSGRCIAFDMIGMGRSDKPNIDYTFQDHARYIEGFIEKLELKDPVLVMHDCGIVAGIHYAMHHPDNVKALAIVSNGNRGLIEGMLSPLDGWDDVDPEVAEYFRPFRESADSWKLVTEQNVFINEALPKGILRGIGPEQLAYYNEPYHTSNDRKAIWAWLQQFPIGGNPPETVDAVTRVNHFIRQTKIPKLFIHGEPDGIKKGIPMVKWFIEFVKNIEFRSVGQVGYFLQEDCPEAIGTELDQWIRRLNSPGLKARAI